MTDEYSSSEGVMGLEDMNGLELVRKVSFMLEGTGDRHAFMDITFTDEAGDERIIRLSLIEENIYERETRH